jgi:hypothetical protein
MNKYLLLRDNKQSGPYSVPELVEKGIKPYDLVWLDGKSVAWRYPSEIEELKAYAPTVEEQPFDRFYKRPEPVDPGLRRDDSLRRDDILRREGKKQDDQLKHSPYEPKVATETTEQLLPPQKKVYINFPAAPAKKAAEIKAVPEKKAIVPEPLPEPVSFTEKTNYIPTAERVSSHNTYSIKAAPNKNYIYYAAAAGIILIGFIVVLFINNSTQKEQLKELNTIVKEIENKKANEAALATQVKNITPEPAPRTSETIVNPELLSDNNDYNKPKNEVNDATPPAETSPVKKSDKPVEIAPGITYKERPVLRRSDNQQQVTTPAGNESTEAASPSSENIYKLVSVKPNSYKTGVLGGISNLQFELTNNSKRELYKVAIEIKYLGPEKKVVNKQTVYFENVSPGEHSTIDVPKSKRGVSLEYTITDIKS